MRRHTLALPAVVLVLIGLTACATPRGSSAAPGGTASGTTSAPSPTTTATIETVTVTETKAIPFTVTTVNDSTISQGQTVVRTPGVDGVRTLTYQVTMTNGRETDRKLVNDVVTTPPVAQVNAVGTKVAVRQPPAQSCDPNYAGACVPIASDVDCAGGSGNGPAYVRGPVTVVGQDIYDLDSDNDGIGCE